MQSFPSDQSLASRVRVFLCALLALSLSGEVYAADSGRTAPSCALTPADGGQGYDLSRFRGQVLYVDFWASWCGPCAQSIPFLNSLDSEFRNRGLHIIGVNLDENFADAKDFLTQHPANFSIASDANAQCAAAFGVKAMPSSYVIDRNGVIRHEQLGFRPGEAAEIRKWVEQLLTEEPSGQPKP